MKTMLAGAAAASLLLVGGAGAKQSSTPGQSQQGAAPTVARSQAAPRRVCRTLEVTGSRLSTRRVCLTQAEWNREGAIGRDQANQLQRGTPTVPSGN